MKTVIRKLFYDFEKEEKWLNKLSNEGLAMVDYSFGRYVFEDCISGEYEYKIQYMENYPTSAEGRKYIEFIESTGIEHVSSYIRWVYFRKKSEEVSFDIFSDLDSKIGHYRSIIRFISVIAILNLFNFLFNSIVIYIINGGLVINFYLGLINLFIVFLLSAFIYRLYRRLKGYKKQRVLME